MIGLFSHSTIFRAEIGLLILSSGSDSGCRVRTEKTRPRPSRSCSVVIKDIAIDAEGLGFNSQAGQIGHSVANGSPPLRRFFGAALPKC